MDKRLAKISIGLAFESAITNGIEVEILLGLYSDPTLEEARMLHHRLIASRRHYDREVAIWLELILEKAPSKANPRALAVEMRKMEFLLYLLINRASDAGQEVNDWMNYIANAAESLTDGYWIDAKILLSQALEISQSTSIDRLKSDAKLTYELDVLQRATASYFTEVIAYPLRLAIPETRIGAILKVQEILLDLMQMHYQDEEKQRDEKVGTAIRRLKTAMQYLMNETRKVDLALQEINIASQYLAMGGDNAADRKKRKVILECDRRIRELMQADDIQETGPGKTL